MTMKRVAYSAYYLFIVWVLIACTLSTEEKANELIKPGDKIGEMSVEQSSTVPYPQIWQFCDYMPDEQEPFTFTSDCDVPLISGLDIAFGWFAKETKFTSNWDAMEWELSIDGYPVALEDFDWQEFDYPQHGEDNKERRWVITLKNLAPGEHTLHLGWTSDLAVDDGFNIYQSGTYEHKMNFSVLDKVVYPIFSSTVDTGQNPYTSEKAQLDFLLYLPDEYREKSQQEWPMIVYLHGAHLRGATLDLLMEHEPLPKQLGKENDFPFIVVSPLGDGEFEFWAKDEMINPLFILLEEIQTKLSVDTQRIYLTGNDMGGNGVWAIGLRYPEYFAALAPVAGYFGYPFEVPENICDLKDVPVWAFHGGRDQIIPLEVEQELVDALNTCGGNAQITVSPRMKLDVPYRVYENPELYDWFLSHELE
jgi:hypothetical protein